MFKAYLSILQSSVAISEAKRVNELLILPVDMMVGADASYHHNLQLATYFDLYLVKCL